MWGCWGAPVGLCGWHGAIPRPMHLASNNDGRHDLCVDVNSCDMCPVWWGGWDISKMCKWIWGCLGKPWACPQHNKPLVCSCANDEFLQCSVTTKFMKKLACGTWFLGDPPAWPLMNEPIWATRATYPQSLQLYMEPNHVHRPWNIQASPRNNNKPTWTHQGVKIIAGVVFQLGFPPP